VESPGGDDRPAEVVGRLPALPLVEADGLLADLPLMAAGAPPTVPAAEVMVLAAADTPASVLADLADAAGSDAVPLVDVEDATALASGAVQARIYALMAVFCLVLALLVLAASVTRERAAHGREAAALRVVGVPLAQVRGSARREVGALTVTAVVATVAGGLVGVALLLSNLTLVTVPLHAVPLDVGVTLVPLAAAALVAALLVLVVGGRSRSVKGDTSRPAILREEV
jgi:predicted lysophospholipase L1 biosynthesis ABC-type transport system permease subunit